MIVIVIAMLEKKLFIIESFLYFLDVQLSFLGRETIPEVESMVVCNLLYVGVLKPYHFCYMHRLPLTRPIHVYVM